MHKDSPIPMQSKLWFSSGSVGWLATSAVDTIFSVDSTFFIILFSSFIPSIYASEFKETLAYYLVLFDGNKLSSPDFCFKEVLVLPSFTAPDQGILASYLPDLALSFHVPIDLWVSIYFD